MIILKKNLDIVKNLLAKKDMDWIHLIIGKEGIGKTTLGLHICRYVDPTFTASRIVNDLEDLKRIVKYSKPGQAVLIDEGALFFYSGDAMTKDTKKIIKLFTAIRAYNLFFCICVPNYYDIVSRIRDHRVKSACRVVCRGWFWFYSRTKLNQIKRKPGINREIFPSPIFRESFDAVTGKLWDNYIIKKKEILEGETKSDFISANQASKILDISPRMVVQFVQKGIIDGRRYRKVFRIRRDDVLNLKYKTDALKSIHGK